MYISRRSGADNPRGQNFDVNRNLLSLWSFTTSFKQISLKSDFIYLFFFFSWFYTCIYSPGAGADNPLGMNFDVNRNILSLRSFVASFKQISLKSDFIYVYSPGGQNFNVNRKPWARGRQPSGDKILRSTEMSCYFIHLLQVSKNVFQFWFYTVFSWFNTCI